MCEFRGDGVAVSKTAIACAQATGILLAARTGKAGKRALQAVAGGLPQRCQSCILELEVRALSQASLLACLAWLHARSVISDASCTRGCSILLEGRVTRRPSWGLNRLCMHPM